LRLLLKIIGVKRLFFILKLSFKQYTTILNIIILKTHARALIVDFLCSFKTKKIVEIPRFFIKLILIKDLAAKQTFVLQCYLELIFDHKKDLQFFVEIEQLQALIMRQDLDHASY